MAFRSLIVTLGLAAAAAYHTWGTPVPRISTPADLEQLPLTIGDWTGRTVPLDPWVLNLLPVDTYIHRYYADRRQRHVNLYVGYHDDSRPAVHLAPHTPLLCLPAHGWHPLEVGRLDLPLAPDDAMNNGRSAVVTRVIAGRALERQVVLFWYQVNGRAVADDYALKTHVISNVVRARTSHVALVRVMVRVDGTDAAAQRRADETAREFAAGVFAQVEKRLPS
jgi:EpsI family protein